MKSNYVVPIREKLAYGVGDLAINIAYGGIGFFMLWFMVNVGGISPAKAGSIFMIARIWDAVSDYIMGRISDRTRSKWGRRRPYIFFGAIPMGIFFALLWFVPGNTETMRFFYYLLIFMLFNTAFTVVAVPYGALMPEMTQNYDERTSLSGFRMGSSFIGTLIGAAGITLIVDVAFSHLKKSQSFPIMGILFGVLVAGILFITAFGTKERVTLTAVEEQNYEGFFQTLKSFFKLKEFRIIIGMFLCNMIGFDIIMAVFFFFLQDVVKIQGDATLYMAIPLVIAVAASPLWIYLANKMGKRWAYITAAIYFALSMTICLIIPQGNTMMIILVCILSGVGISASQIIPFSILPDIIEIDEYRNGTRREGAFFGITTFIYKLASAVAIAGVGKILSMAGYMEANIDDSLASAVAVVQPDSAITAVRILIGLAPGIFFLISALFVFFLPITKESFEKIMKELEERKKNQAPAV